MRIDHAQQKALERFFKEETTWFANHVLYRFLAILLIGISLIMLCFPYLSWAEETDKSLGIALLWVYMLYLYGTVYLAYPYSVYKEQTGMPRTIYELVRYLPVSIAQICIFKSRKVMKPCLWITLFTIAVRVSFSIGCYHRFSFMDVLLPAVFLFGVPVLLSVTEALVRT